jgi:hypothetical protein
MLKSLLLKLFSTVTIGKITAAIIIRQVVFQLRLVFVVQAESLSCGDQCFDFIFCHFLRHGLLCSPSDPSASASQVLGFILSPQNVHPDTHHVRTVKLKLTLLISNKRWKLSALMPDPCLLTHAPAPASCLYWSLNELLLNQED